MVSGQGFKDAAQKAVDEDHDFALAHQLLSHAFRNEDEAEAAQVQATRATELAQAAPEGERRLIEAMQLRGKPEEAFAAWKPLAADFPREGLVRVTLGQLAFGRYLRGTPRDPEMLRLAQAELTAALQLEPQSRVTLSVLADTFLQSGDYAGARRLYEQDGPDRPRTDSIALTYMLEGKLAEARQLLRQHVVERRVQGVAGWNYIAHMQLEADDAEEALQSYERGYEALKANDWSEDDKKVWVGRYHHGRGRCLARLAKPKEAWAEVEVVKTMIDDGGEDGKRFLPAWHFLAGYVKLEAGEYQAALDHLKEAGPQHDPHRTELMGEASEGLGDTVGARKYYEEVLARKRASIDGAAAYMRAKTRLGRLTAEPAAVSAR
jgi:tetratricopeptide (TPR) repeat protein